MGRYETRQADNSEVKAVIENILNGYTYDGVVHKPNPQIATILLLQANMGCRINDIINLRAEDIIWDGDVWKLDIVEQKTGKRRNFVVNEYTMGVIERWKKKNEIVSGRLFKVSAYATWKQMRAVTAYLGYENFSCHSIRKNAGMRVYIESGKDLALVSQYYQHSSPKITAQYLKRSSKQIDDVLDKTVLKI